MVKGDGSLKVMYTQRIGIPLINGNRIKSVDERIIE